VGDKANSQTKAAPDKKAIPSFALKGKFKKKIIVMSMSKVRD
jgi:hypothetical protein